MEFQDVVLRRRMVRDFSDEPVAPALVEQLLINATRIPSAGYSQGFAFVVLTDPGQRRLFWETTSGPEWRGESESESLTRAPVVILPLAHKQAYLDRYAMPDKAHTPRCLARNRGRRRTGTSIPASASCSFCSLPSTSAWAHCFSPSSPSRISWTPWVCRRAIARSAPSPLVIPAPANAASPSSPRAAGTPVMLGGGSTGDRPDRRRVSQLAAVSHESIGAPTTTLRSSGHDQSPLTSAVEPAVHWPRRRPPPSRRRAARNRP